jgi:hypothetical protein
LGAVSLLPCASGGSSTQHWNKQQGTGIVGGAVTAVVVVVVVVSSSLCRRRCVVVVRAATATRQSQTGNRNACFLFGME